MTVDYSKVYTSAGDFFNFNGNAVMRLSPDAAIDVCMQAADKGLIVLGVEGGKWCNPGFQPDGSCNWSGKINAPADVNTVKANNILAAEDIHIESKRDDIVHNVFLITIQKNDIKLEECLSRIVTSLDGLNGGKDHADIKMIFSYSIILTPHFAAKFCSLALDYRLAICNVTGIKWIDVKPEDYEHVSIEISKSYQSDIDKVKVNNKNAYDFIFNVSKNKHYDSFIINVSLI